MAEQINADRTLPSVVASPSIEAEKKELILTIVFHPETGRIGETANFGKLAVEGARILGRQTPRFESPDNSSLATPLDDPYVSKQALRVNYAKGAVIMERDPTACRIQVGGHELGARIQLSSAQLSAGVPIVIGGRIVLLLRKALHFTASTEDDRVYRAMIGSSTYMAKLKAQISQLAGRDLDVLIRGETGTGKELVAEALHAASDRAANKLITVNMAAIPAALAPTILFGSARGAFTGADQSTVGYFGQAEGGTLFLDEIGETPQDVQAQLLRALQQREIQRVGGSIRRVDLRVISATDSLLEDQSCNFKAALRHRLAESEIALLPLRQHPEDIGELLWAFLAKSMATLGRSHVLPGEDSSANKIARWAELFHQFVAYTWPGNIRELSNYAQQVALASVVSAVIPETVCEHLLRPDEDSGNAPAGKTPVSKSEDYSDLEFLEVLRNARYEVLKAARQLGISRQAVYRRISESPDLCLASELSDDQIRATLHSYGDDLTATAMRLKVSRTALKERIRNTAASRAG